LRGGQLGALAERAGGAFEGADVEFLQVFWTETSRITFGRDGVPFYVSGPYDNPRSVVRTLDRTCGEGNYH